MQSRSFVNFFFQIYIEENQKVRFQKYIDDNKKYLEDEQFWEFQTLQVFINDNPFDAAYTFLTPFEDVPDGEKCTLVGIIATNIMTLNIMKLQKKTIWVLKISNKKPLFLLKNKWKELKIWKVITNYGKEIV